MIKVLMAVKAQVQVKGPTLLIAQQPIFTWKIMLKAD